MQPTTLPPARTLKEKLERAEVEADEAKRREEIRPRKSISRSTVTKRLKGSRRRSTLSPTELENLVMGVLDQSAEHWRLWNDHVVSEFRNCCMCRKESASTICKSASLSWEQVHLNVPLLTETQMHAFRSSFNLWLWIAACNRLCRVGSAQCSRPWDYRVLAGFL